MKTITGIFALALILSAVTVHAQRVEVSGDTEATVRVTPRAEVRTNIEARLEAQEERAENRRVEMETRMESHQRDMLSQRQALMVRLEVAAKARIQTHFENVFTRLNASINRVENLGTRVMARVEALEGRGVDTTETVTLIAEARVKTAAAKTDVAQAEVDVRAEMEKEEVSREVIISILRAARDSVKDAHEAWVNVIASLRVSAQVEASVE